MKKAILATKVGMTQIFNADGVLVPVTVLQAGPCVVTQIKTVDNDGYSAVQVGFVDKKEKTVNKDANGKKEIRNRHGVNKAQMGHFAKAGVSGKRFVREFKFENADEYKLADEIKADIFAEGDKVDVTAISKGKGFQGAIKRLGQHRGPMAHGSKFHRHQGSNGACSSPSRVFKGKGMPGHMGSVKVTTQNLEVVRVDAENNLLLIKGAVPGAKKALITVKETTKSGIILTSSAQEKPQEAEVIAVGPGGMVDGKEVTMQVKTGQKVIYSKYAGTEVKLDGEEYIIVRQSDILAVVE